MTKDAINVFCDVCEKPIDPWRACSYEVQPLVASGSPKRYAMGGDFCSSACADRARRIWLNGFRHGAASKP